jgi:hypothetical protein
MGDDITIGVTEIVNNIEVTAQPNDQIVDISITDNSDEVTLNITPTVVEVNINKGGSFAKWGDLYGTLSEQTDLQNALNAKANLVDGKVPASELPSYVDDIIEVANYAALPATGEIGKIYVTLNNNKIYRWSGSVYIEIAANSAVWGSITGTLSSQTDLQTALNAKQNTLTNPVTGTGLQNFVTKWTGIGSAIVSSKIFDDGTNVGIGSINPSSLLELEKDNATGGGFLNIINTNSAMTGKIADINFKIGDSFGIPVDAAYIRAIPANANVSTGASLSFFTRKGNADPTASFTINNVGAVTINNLAGTGSRMVIANSTGQLSTQAITLGTVTSVAALTIGTTGTDITSTVANETTTPVITLNVPTASAANRGALSAADWTTFNGKQSALSGTGFVKISGSTISYDNSTYALDNAVVKTSTNQVIQGKKDFNLVYSGLNLSLITSDISSGGDNGMLRLLDNTTFNDLFVLESDGAVFAKSFAKKDGTSSQFLMADGSVSTGSGGTVTGTGTTNYIPKFTGSSAIGNSNITDNGTVVAISTDATINGVNIGKGLASLANNIRIGGATLLNVTTGDSNVAISSNALQLNTTGASNIAIGRVSMLNNTTGFYNVAVGRSSLGANTTGYQNTAIGGLSLGSNTTGVNNVSLGYNSLTNLSSGNTNVSLGESAGRYIANGTTSLTISSNSIFIGSNTKALADSQTNQIVIGHGATGLGSNTTVLGNSSTTTTAIYGNVLIGTTTDAGFRLDVNGTARVQGAFTATADAVVNGVNIGLGGGAIASNTRVGLNTLNANTTGASNTAIGWRSLQSNTTGASNTAIGTQSLTANTTASQNTAIGTSALIANTTGASNTAIGNLSLFNNVSGSANVALGNMAGRNIADGTTANTITNNSIYIGETTKPLANNQTNQIVIGHNATGLGSNTTVLGNTSTTATAIYGNLGLGTTSPAAKLDVHSVIRATNTSSAAFSNAALELFSYNGTSVSAGTSLFSTNSDFNYGTIVSNQTNLYGVRAGGIRIATGIAPIVFSNGNADIDFASERMRITSGGNVLIGTTVDEGYKLQVSGKASINGYGLSGDFGADYNIGLGVGISGKGINMGYNATADMGFIGTVHNGTSWKNLSLCPIGGSVYIGISGNNNLFAGSATFSGTVTASGGFFNSDIRLKDLTDYDYNVSDIKPITYLWKDGRDNKKHVGYSAQEVQKVMPDAVNEDEKGFLSVNYVEVLVAKIAELENRIKQLEK